MSVAKKCDRCGKFYEKNEYVVGRVWCRGNRLAGVKTMTTRGRCDYEYDLCDECLDKLMRFLNREEESNVSG